MLWWLIIILNIVFFSPLLLSLSFLQAFFDKDYISSHPEEMERINQLKELMQEQVSSTYKSHTFLIKRFCKIYKFVLFSKVHVLGVGLAVHEKLVHPEMRPLHKKLVDQFHVMRSGLSHVSIYAAFQFTMLSL